MSYHALSISSEVMSLAKTDSADSHRGLKFGPPHEDTQWSYLPTAFNLGFTYPGTLLLDCIPSYFGSCSYDSKSSAVMSISSRQTYTDR